MSEAEDKVIATNKKAFHDYFILEKLECGVALLGTEVKSIREGRVNLKDSYALVRGGETFLLNCHISPYSHGNRQNHDPTRTRKLLLHREEIRKLIGKSQEKGLTLIPLRVYKARLWYRDPLHRPFGASVVTVLVPRACALGFPESPLRG